MAQDLKMIFEEKIRHRDPEPKPPKPGITFSFLKVFVDEFERREDSPLRIAILEKMDSQQHSINAHQLLSAEDLIPMLEALPYSDAKDNCEASDIDKLVSEYADEEEPVAVTFAELVDLMLLGLEDETLGRIITAIVVGYNGKINQNARYTVAGVALLYKDLPPVRGGQRPPDRIVTPMTQVSYSPALPNCFLTRVRPSKRFLEPYSRWRSIFRIFRISRVDLAFHCRIRGSNTNSSRTR